MEEDFGKLILNLIIIFLSFFLIGGLIGSIIVKYILG